MYNVNLLTVFNQIRNGENPQQILFSIMEGGIKDNPMTANLYELAKQNKTKEIEAVARNIVAERGLDFDTEFNSFKQKFGLLNK